MTVTFFFKVTDTGEDLNSLSASHRILTAPRLVVARCRVVVGDRTIHQFLLHHFIVARVVCGDLCVGGEVDGWNVGGVSCISSGGPEEGGLMDLIRYSNACLCIFYIWTSVGFTS